MIDTQNVDRFVNQEGCFVVVGQSNFIVIAKVIVARPSGKGTLEKE